MTGIAEQLRNAFISLLLLSSGINAADNRDSEYITEEKEIPSWTFGLRGYVKNLGSTLPVESCTTPGRVLRVNYDMTRFRLSPEILSPDSDFLFHVDADNELTAGNRINTPESGQLFHPSTYNDLVQPSWEPVDSRNLLYRVKLHRIYAKLTRGNLTLTAGRQLVRFGNGRLWNPLDLMNPVSPTLIEGAEELPGTDALRIQYFPLDTMELSLVIDQKRYRDKIDQIRIRNTNSLARLRTATGDAEIAALGGWIARRGVAGMDGSYIVMDGMARCSLMYSNPADGHYFLQSGAGYEYTFHSGTGIITEYFFNGASIRHNRDVENAMADRRLYGVREENYYILANQFLTMNRHYLGIAVDHDITPLLHGNVFLVWDIEGTGMMALPSLTYSLLQDVDVSLSLITGVTGESGRSDFDVYSCRCAVYGYAVWYF